MRLLLRLIINAVALVVAAWLVPGITVSGDTTSNQALTVLGVAVIFGLVNALVKPVLTFIGFPFIVLTLGILLLVINALMLWLTSWLAGVVGLPFNVDGFWSAVWGSIILSIVAWVLSSVFDTSRENA